MDPALVMALKAVVLVAGALQLVPIMVWLERKTMAFIQDRPGPERASILGLRLAGLMHGIADAGKLLTKEDVIPARVDRAAYIAAPAIGVAVALLAGAVIPVADDVMTTAGLVPMQVAKLEVGILYTFAVSSLGVYAIVLAGWASRSSLSLLGALRSAAQLISYELPLSLAALTIPLVFGTLEPNALVQAQGEPAHYLLGVIPPWGIFIQPVAFGIFLVAAFAETNRLPFDLPEGESEIVGYHVEYSSMKWGMFFMAEYVHVAVASAMAVTLFLGGWQIPWAPTDVLRREAGLVAVLGGVVLVGLGFALATMALGAGRRARATGLPVTDAGFMTLVAAAIAVAGVGLVTTFFGSTPGPGTSSAVAAIVQVAVFGAKVMAVALLFIWVRWTLPRFRYDQVMRLGWRQLLPVALVNLIVTAGVLAWAAGRPA